MRERRKALLGPVLLGLCLLTLCLGLVACRVPGKTAAHPPGPEPPAASLARPQAQAPEAPPETAAAPEPQAREVREGSAAPPGAAEAESPAKAKALPSLGTPERREAPAAMDRAEAEAGNQGAGNETSPGGVIVGVAVVGKEGKLLFGPREVSIAPQNPWGATALGALEATGLAYNLPTRFPGLVEAIAGEPNRGLAGWMYQVNDEVPLVPAAKKLLRPQDRVVWWYSRDINQAPPRWAELAR